MRTMEGERETNREKRQGGDGGEREGDKEGERTIFPFATHGFAFLCPWLCLFLGQSSQK
jgi:hypothetical protein